MSNVAPNGQIRFLTSVPIDENYENSLDFLTVTEQTTYFLSLTPVYTMIGATRVRDGVIDVSANADDLLSANYLMFQNQNFSTKWFYAFITNIEYINNNMARVYYAIDDIQTWMFDVTLEECYVEREHTTTDGLFEHLVDEGIGTSNYTCFSEGDKTYSRFTAILYTSYTTADGGGYANCEIHNGSLKGLSGMAFDLQDNNGNWYTIRDGYDDPETESETIDNTGNGLEKLNLWIYRLTKDEQKDSIVGVIVVPKHFVGTTSGDVTITQVNAVDDNLGFTNIGSGNTLDGSYIPTNKKLYNAPFCMIDIVSNDGQVIHIEPEFLKTGNNLIQILSCISPTPSLLCIPKYYKGAEFAWEKAITIDSFPQASVSIDGYSAWVASGGLKQLRNTMIMHSLGGIGNVAGGILAGIGKGVSIGGAVGGVAGGLIGAGVGTVSTITDISNDMNKLDVSRNLPPEVKGSVDTSPLVSNKTVSIGYRKMSLKKDILISIDNYFTMFGYKVNKIKTPSRRNRPHYTYIKTKGCKVNGGAPADAISRIQSIYDNGIRFWITASEVGHYTTIDNRPI